MPANANRLEAYALVRCAPTRAELEQRKLGRLRELRAIIESLRTEQAGKDPLLAWVIDQEKTQNPWRDRLV
jgi:hypothetical protein